MKELNGCARTDGHYRLTHCVAMGSERLLDAPSVHMTNFSQPLSRYRCELRSGGFEMRHSSDSDPMEPRDHRLPFSGPAPASSRAPPAESSHQAFRTQNTVAPSPTDETIGVATQPDRSSFRRERPCPHSVSSPGFSPPRLGCCRTLFAAGRLSPSAPERVPPASDCGPRIPDRCQFIHLPLPEFGPRAERSSPPGSAITTSAASSAALPGRPISAP